MQVSILVDTSCNSNNDASQKHKIELGVQIIDVNDECSLSESWQELLSMIDETLKKEQEIPKYTLYVVKNKFELNKLKDFIQAIKQCIENNLNTLYLQLKIIDDNQKTAPNTGHGKNEEKIVCSLIACFATQINNLYCFFSSGCCSRAVAITTQLENHNTRAVCYFLLSHNLFLFFCFVFILFSACCLSFAELSIFKHIINQDKRSFICHK